MGDVRFVVFQAYVPISDDFWIIIDWETQISCHLQLVFQLSVMSFVVDTAV